MAKGSLRLIQNKAKLLLLIKQTKKKHISFIITLFLWIQRLQIGRQPLEISNQDKKLTFFKEVNKQKLWKKY